MIIKNISDKIINVGTTVLMPDATMSVNKKMRKNPALMAFEKHNYIIFIEEEKDKEKAPKAKSETPKAKPETPKPAATPDPAETATAAATTETQK